MQLRGLHEFKFIRKPDPAPTVEVDTASREKANLHVVDIVRPMLARFASQHPTATATVYLYGTTSINFGKLGNSDFFVVAGSEKVLTAIRDAFAAHRQLESRVSDYVSPSDSKVLFHLENGQLWQVLDADNCALIEPGSEEEDKPALPDELDDWEEGLADTPAANAASPRRGRVRVARADASVGAIRKTIEDVFGLPAGSVALCGPDGRSLRADASIDTLRRRWDSNRS